MVDKFNGHAGLQCRRSTRIPESTWQSGLDPSCEPMIGGWGGQTHHGLGKECST